jgi:hypothetical protein
VGAGHVDRIEPTPAQRAALALADAFMTDPAGIEAPLRDELLRHFTPEQVLELLLDLVSWTQQKIQVCLGIDEPLDPAGPTPLDIDERGRTVILSRPQAG